MTIGTIDSALPTGTGVNGRVSNGDDQIRGLKVDLQDSFPNWNTNPGTSDVLAATADELDQAIADLVADVADLATHKTLTSAHPQLFSTTKTISAAWTFSTSPIFPAAVDFQNVLECSGSLRLKANDADGGASNISLGNVSLNSITTGTDNCVLGAAALFTNTIGSRNVALGSAALFANVSGNDNVAIGQSALDAAATSSENVAIGVNALTTQGSIGANNVAVGYDAGASVSSGDDNVFVGHDCGGSAGTGNNNVAIGSGINLSGVVSGTVAIGANPATMSGADAISIGHGCGGGASSNRVNIGNSTNRIYADFNVAATWSFTSDERMKATVREDSLGLEFINALRPVTFEYRPPSEFPEEWTGHDPDKHQPTMEGRTHGLIAQDVKEVLDDLCVEDLRVWDELETGEQTLGLTELITPMIRAIQELTDQVEQLQAIVVP